MKKSTVIFFSMTILLSLVLLNINVIAKTQTNSVIEKDGSILLPSQKSKTNAASNFTQAPLKSPEWKAFFDANGKWTVLVDKVTLTPHRAFGKPVQINNIDKITNENVQSASMQFLRDNSSILNLNPDNLKLTKNKKVNKLWYVGYKQVYEGIDVLLSEVELRIREDGKVISFGVEYYNNINVNLTPTVPLSTAMTNAYAGLKFDAQKDITQSEGTMYILPVKNKGKVGFSLVYDINVETSNPKGKFNSFVDAHSGNVIWRMNRIHDVNTTVNVNGLVKEKNSYTNAIQLPFQQQYFKVGSERKISDSNGTWTDNLNAQYSVTAKLEGPWAKVQYQFFGDDETRDSAYFNGSLQPGSNYNLNWNNNNSTLHERNLFYHTNLIHDYVKKLDPDFHGMDFQVKITIIPEYFIYNAGSDGKDITFIGTDSPPNHFAETPMILYHEYTHSLNAQLYLEYGGSQPLGMVNASCHEATADLGPSLMLDDHVLGRGAYDGDTNQNVRDIDNNAIYPDSIIGEPHNDGLILSGAFWDFRKLTTREVAEHIVHFSKYGTPDDLDDGIAFSEWFIEAITTDDNFGDGDQDLSNGSPHIFELAEAFNKHQIGTDLILLFSYEHIPLTDTKNVYDPYIVEFNLNSAPNILNSHPDSVYVVYSTNSFKNLNMAPAVKLAEPDSNKYRAEIPALPNGTMVKYYIQTVESVSKRMFKFTGAYPDFMPYVFLVGYDTHIIEDFEGEPDWAPGSPADNATNGIWEWAIPLEENYNSSDGDFVLQPGEDHSVQGTRCFVTGKEVNMSGITQLMSNMPNGTTSIISGIYDLSKVEKPLIRYYKYFTNYFWYYHIESYSSMFIFSISSNSGSSWIPVDTLRESTWDWTRSIVQIEDYVKLTNKMRFKFTVISIPGQQDILYALTEALVDDFEILKPGFVAPPDVVANFGGTPTTGMAPLSVQFSDSSKGNISNWWWDFGDSKNSNKKNPEHQYTNPGYYNVTLTVTDGENQDTKSKYQYINVIPIKADFTANPLEGIKPLEVKFSDKSLGTVSSWLWNFGDGETSTEQNPTHIFNNEGSYSVTLKIKHLLDSTEVIKENYISVYDAFGASFTTDTTSGIIPLTIRFTDQSFGSPISWTWDFGDGDSSTEQNPSHIYTVQGIYNVSLTVSDGNQQSTKTRTDFISAYNQIGVKDNDVLAGISIYPNPFSTSTSIYYHLLTPTHITLKIYDLMGNMVSSLIDENQNDGIKSVVWNGRNSGGNKANTGMYFYRLQAGSKTFTGKLILY